jgi:hypothetical protein
MGQKYGGFIPPKTAPQIIFGRFNKILGNAVNSPRFYGSYVLLMPKSIITQQRISQLGDSRIMTIGGDRLKEEV